MKNNFVVVILIVLGIAIIFIWIKSNDPRKIIGKNADEKTSSKVESSLPSMVTSEAFSSKRDELRALLKMDNAPIDFYGVVVDESGKPLNEVEVSWAIVMPGSFAPSLGLAASANGSARTSNDGLFSVKNESGCTLEIKSLSKTGYHEVNGTVRSYGYGSTSEPHQPNQLKPEKYVMIMDGRARSVKKQIPLRFDWDGKIKEISIPLPERSEVMILAPEVKGQKSNGQDHDWSIVIQMKNAQLLTGKLGGARLAPIDGYLPEITLKNDREGQRGIEADALIYFKTEDNRFGEIRFSAYSDRGVGDPTGSLIIRWNPDGGRVFE